MIQWPAGANLRAGQQRNLSFMKLETFKAATMAEALARVKDALGPEAVILHTRTYERRYCLGLRRREIVEITAGKGFNVPLRGTRRPATATERHPARQQVMARSPVATEPSRTQPIGGRMAPAGNGTPPGPLGAALLQTPAASNAVIMGISQEMSALKSMVKDLVTQTRQSAAPNVPEELQSYYTQLIQNQVAAELATDVVRTLRREVRPEQLQHPEIVREKLAEQIEKLLPTSGPIARKKTTGPHIVALVGPTGVGKTTTLAKLAANLKLRERRKVGMITLDNYRIAAIEQLRKYAEILDAPIRSVNNIEDLKDAIASMSGMEFILIDTAGRSPNDALKLNELRQMLQAIHPDEIHLVLSSTASQECVELAVNKFGETGADRLIFTKIDEAAHVGVVLNVVLKVNKALSYITTGQDVPDDIEVGRGRRLAQLILGQTV